MALVSPGEWSLTDLIVLAGLVILVADRLLDVTGKLPSSKRLRSENEHLTQVNASYLGEIEQLKARLATLQLEVDRLKMTDMSAMLAFLRAHDDDMKKFVPSVVGALQEVRDSLHDLAQEIRSGRPISA